MADKADQYSVGLYHHLEALRQLSRSKLLDALRSAKSVSMENETWYRLIDYQYSNNPLSMIGSLVQGGRFNIGRDLNPARFPVFPALYVGSDFKTAYAEKFGGSISVKSSLSPHEFALRDPHSFSSVCLKVTARNLFDLGATSNLEAFSSVIQRFDLSAELKMLARELGKKPPWLVHSPTELKDALLASNWRAFPVQFEIPANSQVFAQLLIEAGYEGVIYPSTKGNGNCAALFPQNFAGPGSHVSLSDPAPLTLKYRVLDMDTFDALIES